MNKPWRITGITLVSLSLSACYSNMSSNGNPYPFYYDEEGKLYQDRYGQMDNPSEIQEQEQRKAVVVPESYHVGRYHAPTSHKDRDQSWVESQNPQGYTIELARGDKAAQVANALFKAPKNDRMAQVKYQRGNTTYYEGVYGNFPDYQSAEQALSNLPEDVRQKARIKTWGSIQNQLHP